MCRSAFRHSASSFACIPCRHVAQYDASAKPRCPKCQADLTHVGVNFQAPRKRDAAGWAAVAAYVAAGNIYSGCGCTHQPPLPRTAAQVRQALFERPFKRRNARGSYV